MENLIEIKNEVKIRINEAEKLAGTYQDYKITDNAQYSFSANDLKAIKTRINEIEELRKSITKPIDIAKANVMNFFRAPLEKLAQAEGYIKRAMLGFQQEQERKRQEEERKLQELARKEEEKQRKALEERAKKAEEKGNLEKAEELRNKKEEVYIPAPIVQSQVEKVKGISTKTNWYAEVYDLMELVKAIVEGKAPITFIEANMTILNTAAKANKDTLSYPGVKFLSKDIISSGRR